MKNGEEDNEDVFSKYMDENKVMTADLICLQLK